VTDAGGKSAAWEWEGSTHGAGGKGGNVPNFFGGGTPRNEGLQTGTRKPVCTHYGTLRARGRVLFHHTPARWQTAFGGWFDQWADAKKAAANIITGRAGTHRGWPDLFAPHVLRRRGRGPRDAFKTRFFFSHRGGHEMSARVGIAKPPYGFSVLHWSTFIPLARPTLLQKRARGMVPPKARPTTSI